MTEFLPLRSAVPLRRFALTAALVLSVAPTLSTQAASDTTVTGRNEIIVREAFQRWATGANRCPTLLAPGVVWTIPGSGPVAGT